MNGVLSKWRDTHTHTHTCLLSLEEGNEGSWDTCLDWLT